MRWKSSSSAGSRSLRVLQEREGGAVGRGEVAEEVVAAVEQLLEHVEPLTHAPAEGGDTVVVGILALQLVLDRVRRHLPDLVEPVEEYVELGSPGGIAREQRRVGMPLSSRWRRIRIESGMTSSPSTSTGTSGWPLTSSTGERSS